MAEKEYDKISLPHLIVCEGLDAKLFMIYLLQPLIKSNPLFEQFQVIEPGGNDDLRLFIKTLPNLPNFDTVKSITIVRDAENNSEGSNQSVQTLLKNAGFIVPDAPCVVALPTEDVYSVKVGYALFPKLNSHEVNGTLEDLCLNTLANPDKDIILEIVDNAMKLYQKRFTCFKRPHKNRLHTYLSLSDDFVGMKIGQSAQANAFDFSASMFEPLYIMLSSMLEEQS